MSYIITGGNNTVTSGSPIQLSIHISRESLEEILLMGVFTIKGFANIASGKSLENTKCVLYGQKADDGTYATTPTEIVTLLPDSADFDKQSYRFSKYFDEEYTYITIEIHAETALMNVQTTHLTISFYDKNNTDSVGNVLLNAIDFEVYREELTPEILSFTADPSVLQGDVNQVALQWQIKGNTFTYKLLEGLTVLDSGEGSGLENRTYTTVPRIGDHLYTLEVTQGNAIVTNAIKVRALDNSELSQKANPQSPLMIGNFCASQNLNYLFSLMLKKEGKNAVIDHIGYTSEGFSGHWDAIALSQADKDALKPFAASPMVHLRRVGEVYGSIFFIGGSYVKPLECENAVAIIHLDSEEDKVSVVSDLPWESRMGHSCTLFTHGGVDKIWLLGGVDEYGNTLDDVWVSGNGKEWDNLNKNGVVQTKNIPVSMNWDARCLAGVTVQLDDHGAKKALWLGGGFSEIGGKETSDVWTFENEKWSRIYWSTSNPFSINDNSYLSSGLAFIGRDTVQSTGISIIGGYDRDNVKRYFKKINLRNGYYSTSNLTESTKAGSFDTSDNAYVVTAYFKGSLWFMVFTNEGDIGITYSKLYYWIPIRTSQTLILS
ncbi:hypothetical protein ACFO3O_02360 [Dokdonia ponticola]|uniref:Uncharacterized protein n=1 Tax=Dokdonia ponticola TaxID=2041041 RepID=A0ABV9HRC9_9FLAO